MPSPSYRCAAHSSDGTLKQLAQSKTMCIAEVVELHESLSPVVKQFSYSIKNKKTLNSTMELLNKASSITVWYTNGSFSGCLHSNK